METSKHEGHEFVNRTIRAKRIYGTQTYRYVYQKDICLTCSRIRTKRWQDKHREKTRFLSNLRNHAMRKKLDEIKNKPCMDCGQSYPPYVMDFDHRDPSSKLFCVAQGYRSKSLKRLLTEIEKCDLVCANCHRIRTHSKEN